MHYLLCEKDVGMGLCQYIDLCFHASSLACLHTFGRPSLHLFTFFMFLFSCFYTFLVLISVTARPKSKKCFLKCMVTTTPELEQH